MSLVRISEQSDSVLQLVPSFVPKVAMALCLVAGAGFSLASLVRYRDPVQMVVLLVVGCAFLLTVLLIRSQQRQYEVNGDDAAIYVIGRQTPDMYAIPFGAIAGLRIATRVRIDTVLAEREERRGNYERAEKARKTEYYLDVLRRDSGYETLDRSVSAEEIIRLGTLLAERIGVGIVDEAGLGAERSAAATDASGSDVRGADVQEVPSSPPPGSILQFRKDKASMSYVWSRSPGLLVLVLMGLVGVGMLGIGALGILELLREGGSHWVGIAATLIAGVLAYQISWRFMYGVFCNGFVAMNASGVHAGYHCLGNEHEGLIIPLEQVVTFRVKAPRYRRCTLEVVTRDGRAHTLASLSPGLFPLTVGDLHWMNASLAEAYRAGTYV